MGVKRIITSGDGRISVPFEEINNVCICYSIYPLLQFLLLMDEDDVKKHTCFFMGSEISQQIRNKLPCYCYDTKPLSSVMDRIKRISCKIFLRIVKNLRYPFMKTAKIYAQDFGYLSILIGDNHYSMLEEAPDHLNYVGNMESFEFQRIRLKSMSLKGKLESFLYGKISTRFHGDNDQCDEFFLTEPSSAIVLENKIVHVDSLESMWKKSSVKKRNFILSVFDLTRDDEDLLASYPIIFLSQPWVNDLLLKESDYVSLLNEAFSYYNIGEIIIKCHPRDSFDYKKYFPNVQVFSKPVNMQLLLLVMSGKLKKVVTFSSSAVDLLPDDVEIDWFGVPAHKLTRVVDDVPFIYNRPYNKINWK